MDGQKAQVRRWTSGSINRPMVNQSISRWKEEGGNRGNTPKGKHGGGGSIHD
jgi:hypothetical protein